MIGDNALYRAATLGLSAAAPGLIIFAMLAASGLLAIGPALIAGAAAFVATGLIVGRSVTALTRVRDAVGSLAADKAATSISQYIPRQPAGPAGELWLAIVRLTRLWSERIHTAEARLATAEAVIASVPDPLILLDARRRVVHANAQAESLLGVVEGPHDLAATLRNPAVLAAADAVLAGETARVVEFALTAPIERQLQAHLARIDRSSPDPDAVAVLTLHDITQLKRAEQMRGDFIANASHELRTPLASLSGFIETLQGPARSDAPARDRFLAIMKEQATRMARLIDDLLSLSRIEQKAHIHPDNSVDLGALVRQVADGLSPLALEREVEVKIADPASSLLVPGDRDELIRVFENLIENALKYGAPGRRVDITLVGEPANGAAREAVVSVRDYGPGIAPEHLPRLTERFYRVDISESRAQGGTGLGLALVKHILNRHRGRLVIESTPGAGATFAVRLPLLKMPMQTTISEYNQ